MCLIELALFVPPVEQAWFSAKHDPGFNKGFKLLVLGKDCFSHEKIDLFTTVPHCHAAGNHDPGLKLNWYLDSARLPHSNQLGASGFRFGFPPKYPCGVSASETNRALILQIYVLIMRFS